MSKKITIPTDRGNPFVVMVNGTKHIYPPGKTVEVPDGVALEIEEVDRWDDKYEKPVTPPISSDAVLAEAKKYTDSQRLAYEETTVTKRADFAVPAGQGSYDGEEMVIEAPCTIENGKLYVVTINGKSFETYGGEDSRGTYIKIVENEAPVLEAYFVSPRFYVRSTDPNGQGSDVDRNITIDERETIIHAIDGKFLPVGGVGYEETKPKLSDFVMPAGKGGSSSAYIKAPFLFTAGDNSEKTYSVTVNGKTYELTGRKGDTFAIGDYNLENEPHLYIEEYADYNLWNIYVYDPDGLTDIVERHIVIAEKPVVHTIDPKFLPGVCLPVIDVGELPDNLYDFTPEQNAIMNSIAETEMPFIFKGSLQNGYARFCCVMNYSRYANDMEYKSVTGGGYAHLFHTNISIRNSDDGWYCICNVSPNA